MLCCFGIRFPPFPEAKGGGGEGPAHSQSDDQLPNEQWRQIAAPDGWACGGTRLSPAGHIPSFAWSGSTRSEHRSSSPGPKLELGRGCSMDVGLTLTACSAQLARHQQQMLGGRGQAGPASSAGGAPAASFLPATTRTRQAPEACSGDDFHSIITMGAMQQQAQQQQVQQQALQQAQQQALQQALQQPARATSFGAAAAAAQPPSARCAAAERSSCRRASGHPLPSPHKGLVQGSLFEDSCYALLQAREDAAASADMCMADRLTGCRLLLLGDLDLMQDLPVSAPFTISACTTQMSLMWDGEP